MYPYIHTLSDLHSQIAGPVLSQKVALANLATNSGYLRWIGEIELRSKGDFGIGVGEFERKRYFLTLEAF